MQRHELEKTEKQVENNLETAKNKQVKTKKLVRKQTSSKYCNYCYHLIGCCICSDDEEEDDLLEGADTYMGEKEESRIQFPNQ